MREAIHIIIKGEVQGVMYRYYAQMKARELGLTGYVRNLPDGDVEILAEGDNGELMALAEWTKEGSPYSVVEEVIVRSMDYSGKWQDFYIAPS